MLLSSAAVSLARVRVTRATIGGRPPVPLLLAPSKNISLWARCRFVGMVTRNKSTATLVDAPSGGRAAIDPNVVIGTGSVLIGVLTFAITCFGFYSAIASNIETKINDLKSDLKSDVKEVKIDVKEVKSEIKGEINLVTTMLESKIDGQDRKLAGQDRKVEGFGEKIVLHDLKYESKKNWSWFEPNSSPVKSDDRTISSVVTIFSDNLDAKFEAIYDVTDNLNTKVEAIRNATNKLDSKLNVMQDELKSKTKGGNSSSSKK
jgi:hypothetical protein